MWEGCGKVRIKVHLVFLFIASTTSPGIGLYIGIGEVIAPGRQGFSVR